MVTAEQLQRLEDLATLVTMAIGDTAQACAIVDSGHVTGVTTAKARIAIRNAYDNLQVAAAEMRAAAIEAQP
jgi:hypothetical protein